MSKSSDSLSSKIDPEWQDVQEKTFTKWLNSKLASRIGTSEIKFMDLSDGILLPLLLETIGTHPFKNYNKGPSLSRIKKLENINQSLEYIKQNDIKITNIGAVDIVDGNKKLMLGLVWTLILRFVVTDINEGELTAKQGLLLWCQRRTEGYKNVNIKSFSMGWSDGLAFCALIHSYRPDLIEDNVFEKMGSKETLELAFNTALKCLNIPRLLDPEDVYGLRVLDERSIITYVAQYFHRFMELDQIEAARKRVLSFSNKFGAILTIQKTLESKIEAVRGQIRHLVSKWDGESKCSPAEAERFLSEEKNSGLDCITEFQKADSLFTEVQAKRAVMMLPPFTKVGDEIEKLHVSIAQLLEKEVERRRHLHEIIRKDAKRRKMEYATAANELNTEISSLLHSIEIYERQNSLDEMISLRRKVESLKPLHETLVSLYGRLTGHREEVNEYTLFSPSDIQRSYDGAKSRLERGILALKSAISERSKDIKPDSAKVKEIEKTFYHFDKERSGLLSLDAFKASCDALGLGVEEEQLEVLFGKLAVDDKVSLKCFMEYTIDEMADDDNNPDKLKAAFCTLSGKNGTISEAELISGLRTTRGPVEFLVSAMPKMDDNRFDYNIFVDDAYSSTCSI